MVCLTDKPRDLLSDDGIVLVSDRYHVLVFRILGAPRS